MQIDANWGKCDIQWHSMALSGSLWQSVAVCGCQWQSVAVCDSFNFYKLIINIGLSAAGAKADGVKAGCAKANCALSIILS